MHFEFEGVGYDITDPRNIDIEQQFVIWVQQEAYKSLLPLEKTMSTEHFRQALNEWRVDCGPGGKYRWGTEHIFETVMTEEGLKKMALLQFQHAGVKNMQAPQMSKDIIEKIFKDKPKAEELYSLILHVDLSNPNDQASS